MDSLPIMVFSTVPEIGGGMQMVQGVCEESTGCDDTPCVVSKRNELETTEEDLRIDRVTFY